jgi:two-component system response regulator
MNTDEKMILLVEDNPDDAKLTMMAFKKSHIANRIELARDGAEALDFLFRQGKFADRNPKEQIAVVLLDLKLPKIGGLEVLKAMRADPTTELIPVVVLTSSREEEDIVSSYKIGANSYLRKPVEFQKFLAAVGQLGLYWLLLNETPPVQGA